MEEAPSVLARVKTEPGLKHVSGGNEEAPSDPRTMTAGAGGRFAQGLQGQSRQTAPRSCARCSHSKLLLWCFLKTVSLTYEWRRRQRDKNAVAPGATPAGGLGGVNGCNQCRGPDVYLGRRAVPATRNRNIYGSILRHTDNRTLERKLPYAS